MVREFRCRSTGTDCDFVIRSEDGQEVIEFARQHVAETHEGDLSEADVRNAWRRA